VNYFLLMLVGRREFAWFTIPLLIVVFSVFGYFTGFSVRGDDAFRPVRPWRRSRLAANSV
jgi:hypothetical protein